MDVSGSREVCYRAKAGRIPGRLTTGLHVLLAKRFMGG
jgi:hypothetical protein